ncbi:MAG: hypothetical protein J5851_07880 [Oscillospiraceae bacterium]|nr:hypothetical protein [Oscillospiraceae bacterium]
MDTNQLLQDKSDMFAPEDMAANKGMGVIASFPILFWIPLVAKPDSAYGKFCANQGLILLVFDIVAAIVGVILGKIFGYIPAIGPLIGGLIKAALSLAELGGWLLLFISALQGKARTLPFIGELFTAFK